MRMAGTKDQVKRCKLWWKPDVVYRWLSPGDRDEWLEVSVATFIDAEEIPAKVAAALRHDLDGTNGTMPIRATYQWLKLQGRQHDGAEFDIVG